VGVEGGEAGVEWMGGVGARLRLRQIEQGHA
jgi:hypothetical protein